MKYLLFLIIISNGIYAQQLDINKGVLQLSINPKQKTVKGFVSYLIKSRTKKDSLKINARKMTIDSVIINTKKISYQYRSDTLYIANHKGKYKLNIYYHAVVHRAMYFIGWGNNSSINQVWTQGQGRDNSHWAPLFDDTSVKMPYDVQVTFDNQYTVLCNGLLKDKQIKGNQTVWYYSLDKPISSYLLAIAIGKYEKTEYQVGSNIIENYRYPQQKDIAKDTYRYTSQAFDFLVNEIGLPYPWQVYREIPVRDFMYEGMENTTMTLFSDDQFTTQANFVDSQFLETSTHEMAHHWFGDMVTACSTKHHWLQEGFATYYSLLAMKDIYGDDYYQKRIGEIASQFVHRPEQVLVANHGSSFTYYYKGAYVLHLLRKRIGDVAFKTAVKKYLKKYQFVTACTEDFTNIIDEVSPVDLSDFYQHWLYEAAPVTDDIKNDLLDLSTYNYTQILPNIPSKYEMEQLLQSPRRLVVMTALDRLCSQYPNECNYYIKTIKYQEDTNHLLRLHLLKWSYFSSKDIQRKNEIAQKIGSYTSSQYNYRTCQRAFDIYKSLQCGISTEILVHLIVSCTHHYYRYRDHSRKWLIEMMENEEMKNRVLLLNPILEEKSQQYLKRIIKE